MVKLGLGLAAIMVGISLIMASIMGKSWLNLIKGIIPSLGKAKA